MLREHLSPEQTVILYDERTMPAIRAWAKKRGEWKPGQPDPERHVVGNVRKVGVYRTTIDLNNGRQVALPHKRVCCIVDNSPSDTAGSTP